MIKIFISPLLIALLFLLPLQIWQTVKLWNGGAIRRALLVSGGVILIVVSFISTPNGSQSVYSLLSQNSVGESVCPKDLVVVLSGGYFSGSEESDDQLNGETVLRVMKAVQLFKECKPRTMVMSGRLTSGRRERQGELMRALAMDLGIPGDKILLETESVNTREHPIYLNNMGLVNSEAEIAVVTSPWHLRRAMIEFRRYFSNAFPVPAYYSPEGFSFTLSDFLPQAGALAETTKLLHELVGIVWYRFQSF